jgi:hypothetical protein
MVVFSENFNAQSTRCEKVEIHQSIAFGDLWVLAFDSAQIEV